MFILFLYYRYRVAKLAELFEVDLSVAFCIDESCETIEILEQTTIPIPICNDNFTLPGGNTLNGFFEDLGQQVGGAGVNIVLEYLGLAVSKHKIRVLFAIAKRDCIKQLILRHV